MDSLTDPGRLLNDDAVDWRDRTHEVDAATFEDTREHVDSHAIVGITDDDGRVLCHDDGSHGWTLPAATVSAGDDWAATARRDLGELLGATVALDHPVRVRHFSFVVDDAQDSRRADTYDVVFPANVDGEIPAADHDGKDANDGDDALAWFDAVPAGQDGPLADDIRLFLD
ncbi:NUDIX hydrolase [Halorubellus sp. JP-L1]|uniref:NUDIX hydrolase n=1 Tax=Halorubellus sp. JP-L1 TaxID=2715753 RepID=UPI00140BA85E|nr:NUDIX hydrolase [Halorubellus sp. JP-L1]NHN40977.1 NUDIX hydrolase [Halorubellus sp. JP-L1]